MHSKVKSWQNNIFSLSEISIHKQYNKISIDELNNEDKYHDTRCLLAFSIITNKLYNAYDYVSEDKVKEHYSLTAAQVNHISP